MVLKRRSYVKLVEKVVSIRLILFINIFPPTYTSNIVVDLFPTTTKTRKHQNVLGKVRTC